MTLKQADNVMKRVLGVYKNTLPGTVEIWTQEGIIREVIEWQKQFVFVGRY